MATLEETLARARLQPVREAAARDAARFVKAAEKEDIIDVAFARLASPFGELLVGQRLHQVPQRVILRMGDAGGLLGQIIYRHCTASVTAMRVHRFAIRDRQHPRLHVRPIAQRRVRAQCGQERLLERIVHVVWADESRQESVDLLAVPVEESLERWRPHTGRTRARHET